MKLWVDGDSCPSEALDAVLEFQRRTGLPVEVAADRPLAEAENSAARMKLLPHGSGQVDEWILTRCRPGDAALTRDLQLAYRLMLQGVTVINPRGRRWSIRELRRRIRDARFMQAMKAGGMVRTQPPNPGPKNTANLIRELRRLLPNP